MKHRINLIILGLSLFLNSFLLSQEDSIISAKLLNLKTVSEDTSRIHLYHELGLAYRTVDRDSAIYYLQKGLDLSQHIDFQKGNVISNMRFGEFYLRENKINEALPYYEDALEMGEKINLFYETIICYRIVGLISFVNGNYPKALDRWETGNRLAIAQEQWEFIPEFYHNIGTLYFNNEEYDLAFAYFERSRKSAMDHQIVDMYPNALSNMAMVEMKQKNYPEARSYALQILDLADSIPNALNHFPAAYEYLADVAYHYEKYDSAIRFYELMLNHITDDVQLYFGPMVIEQVMAYIGLGKSYLALNRYSESEKILLKAFSEAQDAGLAEQIRNSSEVLSKLYESNGATQKALQFHKVFKNYSDSVLDKDKIQALTRIRMEHEFSDQLKQKELEDLKAQSAQKRRELYYIILIGGVILGFAILFLLYRLQLSKNRQMELSKNNLQLNVDYKNRELSSNVLYLMKQNEMLLDISKRLKNIRYGKKKIDLLKIEEIIRSIELRAHDIGWKDFEVRFNEVHTNFYKNLHERYPNLSPNEQKLCAFLRLNMSTKDISAITYQSTHSINVARSRLRKKMDIDSNEHLVSILNQL